MATVLNGERLGEREHTAFRSGVSVLRHRAAHQGHKRSYVNDGTLALPYHMWSRVLGAEERALEVDIQNAVPRRLAQVSNSAIVSGHNACIIIEHVNASESIDTFPDQVLNVIFVGDIGLHKDGFAAGLAYIPRGLFACISGDIGNDNACSFTRK